MNSNLWDEALEETEADTQDQPRPFQFSKNSQIKTVVNSKRKHMSCPNPTFCKECKKEGKSRVLMECAASKKGQMYHKCARHKDSWGGFCGEEPPDPVDCQCDPESLYCEEHQCYVPARLSQKGVKYHSCSRKTPEGDWCQCFKYRPCGAEPGRGRGRGRGSTRGGRGGYDSARTGQHAPRGRGGTSSFGRGTFNSATASSRAAGRGVPAWKDYNASNYEDEDTELQVTRPKKKPIAYSDEGEEESVPERKSRKNVDELPDRDEDSQLTRKPRKKRSEGEYDVDDRRHDVPSRPRGRAAYQQDDEDPSASLSNWTRKRTRKAVADEADFNDFTGDAQPSSSHSSSSSSSSSASSPPLSSALLGDLD